MASRRRCVAVSPAQSARTSCPYPYQAGQTVTPRALRVLLTNHYLGEPGGTEVAVRDLALGLLRRGHRPVVYAPVLGRTARTLREATIPVVDDPARIAEAPDIIHGSHT